MSLIIHMCWGILLSLITPRPIIAYKCIAFFLTFKEGRESMEVFGNVRDVLHCIDGLPTNIHSDSRWWQYNLFSVWGSHHWVTLDKPYLGRGGGGNYGGGGNKIFFKVRRSLPWTRMWQNSWQSWQIFLSTNLSNELVSLTEALGLICE